MSKIGHLIKELASTSTEFTTFPAIVSDNTFIEYADGSKEYTISVRILGDVEVYKSITEELEEGKEASSNALELHNVRLKAAINGIDEGIICVPRIGSWVLVSTIENMEARTYVSQYSELDRVIFRMKKSNKNDSDTKEVEYVDIEVNPETLELKYGDFFHTRIDKNQLGVHFLGPKQLNEEGEVEQKTQASLDFTKDNLSVSFLDTDEKPTFKATLGKDKASLETANAAKRIAIVNSGDKKGIELISDEHITIEGKIVTIKGTEEINLN